MCVSLRFLKIKVQTREQRVGTLPSPHEVIDPMTVQRTTYTATRPTLSLLPTSACYSRHIHTVDGLMLALHATDHALPKCRAVMSWKGELATQKSLFEAPNSQPRRQIVSWIEIVYMRHAPMARCYTSLSHWRSSMNTAMTTIQQSSNVEPKAPLTIQHTKNSVHISNTGGPTVFLQSSRTWDRDRKEAALLWYYY